ncbi:hypothetical protein [Pseudomonas sp. R5(2019)]|uniref:hypothetical protein n=1 Tax=Pseudomonas sp. R5(2019) TaxID=2697566 RepID=UPI00211572C5|nr:hypothetical protein [Pseudomonas sp. R5(2019)]
MPETNIDLTLPPEMVKELEPASKIDDTVLKPLLPAMFGDSVKTEESQFQLNGRLLSNELQLQLRNDFQREVEGAALEFEFKR